MLSLDATMLDGMDVSQRIGNSIEARMHLQEIFVNWVVLEPWTYFIWRIKMWMNNSNRENELDICL